MQVTVRRTQLGFVVVGLLLLVAAPMGYAQTTCTNDLQGPDDEPGQKDLQQFCETFNQTCSANAGSRRFTWNFDDSVWSGGNTGDACALFDTDADGNANRAVCVTIVSGPAIQANNPKCYTCDDDRPTNCTNSVLTTCTSTCTVTGGATEVFPDPPNTTHTQCNGPSCLTQDTKTDCCIEAGDTGNGVHIDTCSYPSQQPNSDASDCVVTPDQCSTNADCNDNNP